jgi:hypothetical protein
MAFSSRKPRSTTAIRRAAEQIPPIQLVGNVARMAANEIEVARLPERAVSSARGEQSFNRFVVMKKIRSRSAILLSRDMKNKIAERYKYM